MENRYIFEEKKGNDPIYVHVKLNGTEVLFGSKPGSDVIKEVLPPRTIKMIRAMLEDALEELDRDR